MGKVKKSRSHKKPKHGVAVDLPEEEALTGDLKESVLQTILDQIQVANVEEKYCGLQTLSLYSEDPQYLSKIIERNIVKAVAPLLIDPASSVRNAASGALRNLSTLGHEACDALMDQDLMTSLICFFHQYTETWVPDASSKTNNDDVDTIIQCINILLNLCESSDLAIKYLGDSNILNILPRYLDLATFGDDIVINVLQCLFVIIEDNNLAIEKIKSNCENPLQSLLALEGSNPSILLIKTLAAGVIINTCGNISALPGSVINQIILILSNSLSVDHRMVCNQLSSSVPLSNGNENVAPKGKEAHVLEKQLKSVSQMLEAQQSSVEIIANICSSEDGEEVEDENFSDSEDMAENDDVTNESGVILTEDRLSSDVLETMVSLEIFEKVWARTQMPAENVMLILKEYEGSQSIHKKLKNLQSGALLCINNLLSSLPIENLGGIDGLYKIWIDTGKLVFKGNADMNLLESATAVMRASLDKMKTELNNVPVAKVFNELALSDIEVMLTGIKECQVPEIRSNLIRMIGILAMLLVSNLNEMTSNVICTITEFILEQAHKETEVWVLAESVDTLVDLYTEDETDILAARVKLVEKLSTLAPVLKNKARLQKRLPKEYKVLVNTATSNLPRFIKYKKGQVSKLGK